MRLSELPRGTRATVLTVHPLDAGDAIARRLEDLGFVSGEPVRVLGHAPFWRDPLWVEIGYTRFALRRSEAARVQVVQLEEEAACTP